MCGNVVNNNQRSQASNVTSSPDRNTETESSHDDRLKDLILGISLQ